MTISERIFALMKEKGITPRELSRLTNIPYSTISDWKNKNNNPASDKIMSLCRILGVAPETLLGDPDFTINGLPKMDFTYATDPQELRLVESFRKLPADGREMLWNNISGMLRLMAISNSQNNLNDSNTPKSDE